MDSEERMMSQIHVSVESLVYFWNIWKDKILRIFEYLEGLQTQDVNEFTSYGEFCLEYLGVLKQCHNSLTNYVLLYSDADWARNVEHIHVRSIGNKLVLSIDVDQVIHAAQVYWSSQVLSVGFKVLHKLEAIIHTFATDAYDSLSRKCMIFTLIYEVAQFLLGSKNLNRTCQNSDDLEKLIRLATDFSGYIFPLDWQKSLGEDFVSFRGTDICNKFLKQMIVEHCNSRNDLTHSQVGNIAVFVLGSSRLNDELFEKIMKRMNQNLPWKAFFKCLQGSRGSYFPSSSLICRFHGVLVDAYNESCMRECDPISPGFFFYLVERFVIWLSISFKGYFITTKSAFVEWLVYEEIHTMTTPCFNTSVGFLQSDLPFVTHVIKECLNNEQDMIDWINKSPSRYNKSYSLLVSRMVLILCVLRENFGMGSSLLFDLLGMPRITKHLPLKFCDNLKSYLVGCDVTMLAEAFEHIGNSLVVVSFGISKPWFEDFNVVDMSVNRSKNDILRTLFQKRVKAFTRETSSKCETNPPMSLGFWKIFEAINSEGKGSIDQENKLTSNAQKIKVLLEKYIRLLEQNISSSRDMADMVYELKQLCAALDVRDIRLVKQLAKRVQSRKAGMEDFLNQLFHKHTTAQDGRAKVKEGCHIL
ncbi:uncharacterized protein LOC133781433 [Humulus lupulus]|uniref:uncharacterized protein LOC133781433 n=1 Tax=Humulus lupulus TaxID=3486 RepID=UPI002B4058EF|nr:uncharacterized protein LOC133781433 [Humulus lupulus]